MAQYSAFIWNDMFVSSTQKRITTWIMLLYGITFFTSFTSATAVMEVAMQELNTELLILLESVLSQQYQEAEAELNEIRRQIANAKGSYNKLYNQSKQLRQKYKQDLEKLYELQEQRELIESQSTTDGTPPGTSKKINSDPQGDFLYSIPLPGSAIIGQIE